VDQLGTKGHLNLNHSFLDDMYLLDNVSAPNNLVASQVVRPLEQVGDLSDGFAWQVPEVGHILDIPSSQLELGVVVRRHLLLEAQVDHGTVLLQLVEVFLGHHCHHQHSIPFAVFNPHRGSVTHLCHAGNFTEIVAWIQRAQH